MRFNIIKSVFSADIFELELRKANTIELRLLRNQPEKKADVGLKVELLPTDNTYRLSPDRGPNLLISTANATWLVCRLSIFQTYSEAGYILWALSSNTNDLFYQITATFAHTVDQARPIKDMPPAWCGRWYTYPPCLCKAQPFHWGFEPLRLIHHHLFE